MILELTNNEITHLISALWRYMSDLDYEISCNWYDGDHCVILHNKKQEVCRLLTKLNGDK